MGGLVIQSENQFWLVENDCAVYGILKKKQKHMVSLGGVTPRKKKRHDTPYFLDVLRRAGEEKWVLEVARGQLFTYLVYMYSHRRINTSLARSVVLFVVFLSAVRVRLAGVPYSPRAVGTCKWSGYKKPTISTRASCRVGGISRPTLFTRFQARSKRGVTRSVIHQILRRSDRIRASTTILDPPMRLPYC